MSEIVIRKATSADVAVAGQVCFEAFHAINSAHNFPPDIPDAAVAKGFCEILFSHPGFYCVVAEEDGRIVGSNCLDERSSIFGIGPITIDPTVQNRGIGRKLMQAVLDRTKERNAPGVRLVQAAFHNRSLSLYTNLGFQVREPLAVLAGKTIVRQIDGHSVRPAERSDLDACNQLCERVHGHHRGGELADGIGQQTAFVVERSGRITGYTSVMGFFGHTAGETNEDVMALIAATPEFHGPGIFVPSRNTELFRWCLAQGLRVTQPMTLMSLGLYNEPKGAFLPSVTF
ncbi:MAG: GNAT family N-acetyltransferase [Acidobacteriota bacterium]